MLSLLAPAGKKYPKGVFVGRVILFACIFAFGLLAIAEVITFFLCLFYNEGIFETDLSNTTELVRLIWRPIYAIILVLGLIGTISYLRDKGPLISLVSLIAVIAFVISVLDLLRAFNALAMRINNSNPRAVGLFMLDMLDLQIMSVIFFVGWFLTKDYLE